jgi:hypothetical protein
VQVARDARALGLLGLQDGAGGARARSVSTRSSIRSNAWRRRATSCTSPRSAGAGARRPEKSTASIAAMSCSSGAKRRRSTRPLTSTVASSAQASSARRRRSATASGSRCTMSVAARTVAAISTALTARTWVRSAGRFTGGPVIGTGWSRP